MGERAHWSVWSELLGVPFEQDYVQAGPIRTRYLRTGPRDGPAVIFLHGFMSHADVFVRNLAAHGERYRTYAIDLVGMGFSDKPDVPYHAPMVARQVADFMDAVGLTSAAVLGTSFGSRVAARFAVDHPDRLDALTLVSPAGLRFDPVRSARILKNHIADHDESTWEGARAAVGLIVAPDAVEDDLVAVRRAVYSQPGIAAAAPNLAVQHEEATAHLSLCTADEYRSIDAPTLLVKGVQDDRTDLGLARELTSLIPGARLELIEHSIHAPYFERPEIFNRIHLAFLDEHLGKS
ncbi:alpha/beta fold hydrolase [Actinomycetospora sp. TBRC 11914]|uniref:alpha/beta fold hydrolase n=1 Tax=Actinomycetospora sp. TBRC 11914 TaxID=2729387 RepID=UPI00145CA375|nr:alpha/beta hydrolase [Actinomycetospora sp. TBRC 11914]NMO91712.1 alpha/beta hydrolase [Actinomycetospora sp. TBRC 11914]